MKFPLPTRKVYYGLLTVLLLACSKPSVESRLSSESQDAASTEGASGLSDSIAARLTGQKTSPNESSSDPNEILNALTQRVIYLEALFENLNGRLTSAEETLRRAGSASQPMTETSFRPRSEGQFIDAEWVEIVGEGAKVTNDPQLTITRNSRGIPVHKAAVLFCNSKGYKTAARASTTSDSGGYTKCSERILRLVAVIDKQGVAYNLKNMLVSPCDVVFDEIACYND